MTSPNTIIADLSAELEEVKKQNVLLRDAVLAVCCDPEGFVCIDGSQEDRLILQDALADTADLSGYILCDAEPVGHFAYHEYESEVVDGIWEELFGPEFPGATALYMSKP
jgi:hypothetical protein